MMSEVPLIGGRRRIIIYMEKPFQKGWLFVSLIGSDAVCDGQGADDSRYTGKEFAVAVKNGFCGICREIDILVVRVCDRDLHAVFRKELGDSRRLLRREFLAHDDGRHFHEISGLGVGVTEDIFQKIPCHDGVAGAARYEDQVIGVGLLRRGRRFIVKGERRRRVVKRRAAVGTVVELFVEFRSAVSAVHMFSLAFLYSGECK